MRRHGGDCNDQPPLPGLAGQTGEAALNAFDGSSRAAAEAGSAELNRLEHGWMRRRIDDDLVSRAEKAAKSLADRFGSRAEGDGGGKLEEAGKPVFQG